MYLRVLAAPCRKLICDRRSWLGNGAELVLPYIELRTRLVNTFSFCFHAHNAACARLVHLLLEVKGAGARRGGGLPQAAEAHDGARAARR
jgi:hypothetical protein